MGSQVESCLCLYLHQSSLRSHPLALGNYPKYKDNVVFVRYKKKENVRPLPSYLLPIPAAKWKCLVLVQFTAALLFSIYYIHKDNKLLQLM